MRPHSTTLVSATPASALVFGNGQPAAGVSAFDLADSGERSVHLPRLRAHHADGFDYRLDGPNCVLRWARLPAGYSGEVDVVVHFHGYQGHNRMRLAAKAAASGLDLASPGVGRPTLGLVPHGHAFRSSMADTDGFDFPAIDTRAELDGLIDDALAALAGLGGGRLMRARVVLTGHSGGGAALVRLMQSIGDREGVHGFQFFDATYGPGQGRPNPALLAALRTWADAALQRDLAALGPARGDEARRRLRESGSHVRLCFIEPGGTAASAQAADQLLRERLQALVPDAAVRALLQRQYRAQKVARPRPDEHGRVPRTCGGRLLADPGDDLAPDMVDLPAPSAGRAQGWSGEGEEEATASAWAAEAQDVTVPVLATPPRAAGAPTGSAFIASLGQRKGVERESRIFEQLSAGNIPPSLLSFHTVRTSGGDRNGQRHELEYYVMPDVLAIGTESDAVRVPMDAVTAQQVADRFGCLLPTARMVEQIYQAAPTKLAFIAGQYAGTPRAHLQDASSSYLDHSRAIDAQLRRPPTILTAGHKKELVISNGYLRPRRDGSGGQTRPAPMLAFYGAYTGAGVPIQAPHRGEQVMRGHPSFAHEPGYVDYSHGVRLVWPTMKLDGAERRVAEVLRDPELSPLLAAEGPIADPRYTLDRSGHPVAARAQGAAFDDPLALDAGTAPRTGAALGYGSEWDQRLRVAVEGFLAEYMGIPVRIGSQTVRVSPPYFINVGPSSSAASRERVRRAEEHRAAAPAALRSLINEPRFLLARIGKATTERIRELLQDADARGLLQADARVNRQPTPENLRRFLQHYGIGIDCSGFVGQALNRLIELFPQATAADRLADALSTPSAALKGGQGRFEQVGDPAQLCPGDTMWLQGHIRILAWAERRGDRIVFCTAESRASDPPDIGPAIRYWRLVPDAHADGSRNFPGVRLEYSSDLNAADGAWRASTARHVYGHYTPLRRLLQNAGAAPVALQAAPAAPGPAAAAPPRSAVTRDLTQAEIGRLAAVRVRSAADIEAVFRRGGQSGFIDWYNAGLAHSAPFSARGAIDTSSTVRERFTAFWNQVPVAFDRDEINALDFAAFMAISINETRGNLHARPESSGRDHRGARDARGQHPGLAYFFDRIEAFEGRRGKRSYNLLSGNRKAGELFNDADFIDAHGSLGAAPRLARHGNDFGGAWNGDLYPQGTFSTDEDASNGFIMQADFYKFRGRGVIQITGRDVYMRAVDFIKRYRGPNPVLADCARRWAAHGNAVACTRSRTEDWDRLFEQPELLAKSLSLHAGTADDYRRMNTTAATLLHVPPPAEGNARGQTGSIYAMGRRISGSGAYARDTYRPRVLALLHGFLTLL